MPIPPRRDPTTPALVTAAERGLNLSRGTHGTVFTAGQTTVDPQRTSGVTPSFEHSEENRVYYTAHGPRPGASEASGWEWAGTASRARGEPTSSDPSIYGRPVVHEVEPHGRIDVDPNMGDAQHAEFTADKLSIKDTQWIRPVRDSGSDAEWNESAVQGTLPHMNWNQFAHPSLSGIDLNNVGISKVTGQMRGTVEHDESLARISKRDRVKNFGKPPLTPLRSRLPKPMYGFDEPTPRPRDYEQPSLDL